MWSLGIDIGGTFTDIVAWGEGRALARKVLTTHDDPARSVEAASRACSRTHGSTRVRWSAWCTRPRSSPTRSSSAREPAPASSRPGGFATPWRSAANASTSSTTSLSRGRRRSCPATGGSRRPNGWERTVRCWSAWTPVPWTRRCPSSRDTTWTRSRSPSSTPTPIRSTSAWRGIVSRGAFPGSRSRSRRRSRRRSGSSRGCRPRSRTHI